MPFDFMTLFRNDPSADPAARLVVMVLSALVLLPLARLATRGLRRRLDGEAGDLSLLQRIGATLRLTLVWPALTAAVAAGALLLLPGSAPPAQRLQALSLVGFLVLHGLADALIRQALPPGPARRRLRWLVVPLVLVAAALQQTGLLGPLMTRLGQPFLVMGGASFSVLSILTSLLIALLSILGGQALGNLLSQRVLPEFGVETALADALGTVLRSLVIVLGLLVAADALGLDMSSLKIVLGALSVGIGFGLQNVVNNFVSGLILMFERTIKRGDVIRISETEGRVASIGLRSSVIRTRAGHDIIVPNGELVAGQVDNLSFTDSDVRIDVPFGVSYSADPNTVREIVLGVAQPSDVIRPEPAPEVFFIGYGESSLDFELRVWVSGAWVLPRVRSALLFDAWYALKEAGIEIPFPQRDLHVRSGVLDVRRLEGDSD